MGDYSQGTPVFAPDGSVHSIPDAQLQDAMKAGGKLAVQMNAPDGSLHYVPHDQVAAAQAAGGKVNLTQGTTDAPKPAEGFWHSLGAVFGLTPEAKQAAEQRAAGMSPVQEAFAATKPPNPVDLVKNAASAASSEFQKGSQEGRQSLDSLKQGDIKGFLAHQIGQVGHAGAAVAAPLAGNNLSKAGEQLGQGDVSGAAGTATGVAAPVLVSGAVKGTGALIDSIPSTERAGAMLRQVKATAGDVPIDMTKPGNSALELYTQSQRGATLPLAVRKFLTRTTTPDSAPLTYAEAKDFQSNISRLSADEYGKMNPNTRRLVGQLNADLKSSLQGAADTAGKGQQFADAMKEYHNAMRLKGMSEQAIQYAMKAAITGGLGALGYKAFSIATEK